MADHRSLTTCEQRRRLLGERRQREMADDVDALMSAMKRAGSGQTLDDAGPDPGLEQLTVFDGTVLLGGQAGSNLLGRP
jgi:hypothetical protein